MVPTRLRLTRLLRRRYVITLLEAAAANFADLGAQAATLREIVDGGEAPGNGGR